MKRVVHVALVTSLVLLSSCDAPDERIVEARSPDVGSIEWSTARPPDAGEPDAVSMIQLIATPERFNGRRVMVIGFLHQGFESSGLYLHREDHEASMYRNGLWVNGKCGESHKFNRKYVAVEGTFSASDHGHMGLWSGQLNEISTCIAIQGFRGSR